MELAVINNTRAKIVKFEQQIRSAIANGQFTNVEPLCPLTHHFAPGAYGREIFLPSGAVVVGKIHKHAHINVLSKGHVSVMTQDGPEEFKAPRTWVSSPGTKRVVFVHSDAVWTTIHPTNETDLEKVEDFVIAKSYDEYEAFRLQHNGGLQCLG